MLQEGNLGIHTPGALGVAFFVHTQAECIIGRCDDGITDTLKKSGTLRLDERGTLRTRPLRNSVFSNLLEADALGRMPELLMLCCNPDQLHLITGDMTAFLENLAGRGRLQSEREIQRRVPIVLILPNGIVAEQTLQTYEEQLRESMLMGRLPGGTHEMIDALLDRMVRGISLQAGGRQGTSDATNPCMSRPSRLPSPFRSPLLMSQLGNAAAYPAESVKASTNGPRSSRLSAQSQFMSPGNDAVPMFTNSRSTPTLGSGNGLLLMGFVLR